MSERAAFISAILDNWADDTPRLVFADWLQENGEEARAEFIRCQIETARLPEAARRAPRVRALALEAVYGPAWRAACGELARQGRYDRGFLNQLSVSTHRSPALAKQVLIVEPAEFTLNLPPYYDGDGPSVTFDDIDIYAADPILRAVTKIACTGRVGADRFVRLMKSPHLVNLRALHLPGSLIGPGGVKAIAEAPAVFVLESLDLNGSLQGRGGEETDDIFEAAERLAVSPRFAALKYLGLRFNGLGDKSVQTLLASKTLSKTMRLDL